MNQREVDIKTIAHEFAVWETKLANLNALNFTDANVVSEYTIAAILNLIFGYQLRQNKQSNQPAIDLSDNENRIAFQITVTKSAHKIKQTVEKFITNKLYQSYDQLFVLILGSKQTRYSIIETDELHFDPARQVLDLRDLLKQVTMMPSGRLHELAVLVSKENELPKSKQVNAAATFKRSKAIKKKIEKELIKKDLREYYEVICYDPSFKFNHSRLMVRSVEDRKYPDLDPANPAWFRLELWDIYEYGLEFVGYGREILFNKNLQWDLVDGDDDPRKNNPAYQHDHFKSFAKIAFDDMVSYDPETDGYHGYPSLFCHFRHHNDPYIEYTWGKMGNHKTKKYTFKFDPAKRTKLP
jgi:hypothetical protein